MDSVGFSAEVKNKRIGMTFEEFSQFTRLDYLGSNMAGIGPNSAWLKAYDKEEAKKVLLVEMHLKED